MTTMTKKITTVYTNLVNGDNPATVKRAEKLVEMYNAGKTDGYCETVVRSQCMGMSDRLISITGSRSWFDQAAAEEWRDFVVALNDEHDQGLVDIKIEDL